MQPQRIEKAHHRLSLIMHRVGKVRRLLAATVAGQIGKIDAKTGLRQIGGQVPPVLGSSAQPMHQHHHRPTGWPRCKVMHAMARDLNRVVFHARNALPHVQRFIEVADRPRPEAKRSNHYQHTCNPPQPLDRFHPPSPRLAPTPISGAKGNSLRTILRMP